MAIRAPANPFQIEGPRGSFLCHARIMAPGIRHAARGRTNSKTVNRKRRVVKAVILLAIISTFHRLWFLDSKFRRCRQIAAVRAGRAATDSRSPDAAGDPLLREIVQA